MRARLRRLEEQLLPRAGASVLCWYDRDGSPCDPPPEVRSRVEEEGGAWRCAVWVPDDPCGAVALLLGEGDALQLVEL